MCIRDSCKPKQSAYKQVYEAAKEKEMQQAASQPTAVTKDASTLPPVEVSVRKEKVEAVNPTDAAGLRRYSVVIAALSVKLNAESLKQRMENEGYNVILAQNEEGMYPVSYTHLDVYKRQSRSSTCMYAGCRFSLPTAWVPMGSG